MNHKCAHLNGNILAAIDIESTGADLEKHEIVEIGIIPLKTDYTPSSTHKIFHCLIEPDNKLEIDLEACRKVPVLQQYYSDKLIKNKDKLAQLEINGLPPRIASEFLMDWFEDLGLQPGKRIIPIGCNYTFDRGMLQKLLGYKSYEYIFSDLYRDVQIIANYYNDLAYHKNSPQYPFQKVNLQYLCSTFKIERRGSAHTALDDAYVTSQIYSKLMTMSLI
jgi:DNA polymerase III epsilon subunit-like protein